MRLRVLAGIGAALGALGLGASSASAAILYEQIPNGSFTVKTVPSISGAGANFESRAADDFSVPDGQVWTPNSIDVFGGVYINPNPPPPKTDKGAVSLFANSGTTPGNPLLTQSGITLQNGGTCGAAGSSCDFTVPFSGSPALQPGTYWIGVQGQVAGGPGYGWAWATYPPGSAFGNPAVWQNPTGMFPMHTNSCQSFKTLLDCGWTTASDGKDLIYRLNGDLIDSQFTLGGLEGHSFKSLGIDATFPGGGQAVLVDAKAKSKSGKSGPLHTGRGKAASATIASGGAPVPASSAKKKKKKVSVKKVKKTIGGSGTTTLPLKLTSKAKKKLNKGHKVKFKIVVTFTANGGVPFTVESGKLTLVPR